MSKLIRHKFVRNSKMQRTCTECKMVQHYMFGRHLWKWSPIPACTGKRTKRAQPTINPLLTWNKP